MSTTVRKGDGAGKEKKGTSPSTSSTTTKKTTKPLTSSIPSSHGEKKTVSSSTTTRQGPSQVKPTRTTPNEPSRLSKKPMSEPSNPKSAPLRRKSFDHPPPPSHVQKAIRDAKNSRSTTVIKNTTKSASSSSKPSLSDKPVKKMVRSVSMTPSLKKNNALSNTSTAPLRGPSRGTSLIKKATRTSISEANLSPHGISSDIDDHLSIDDDLVNLDNDEVKSLPEISEMPITGSDLGDPATFDDVVKQPTEEEDHESSNIEEGHEPEEDVPVADNHVADEPETQDTTVLEAEQIEEKPLKDQNTVDEPTIKEEQKVEDQEMVEEPTNKEEQKVEDQNTVEEPTNKEEQKVEDQNTVEEPTNKEEQIKGGEQIQTEKDTDDQSSIVQEVVAKDETNKTIPEEKKEDVISLKKEEEKKDEEVEAKTATTANNTDRDQNVNDNSGRKSPVTNVISRSQSMDAKENQQAYNEVIEETATKLRSNNRRNKVLALAGAFESIISLQDSGSGKK